MQVLVEQSDAGRVAVPDPALRHGTVMSAWLAHEIPSLDPVSLWAGLQMPDALLVDLGAHSIAGIAVENAP